MILSINTVYSLTAGKRNIFRAQRCALSLIAAIGFATPMLAIAQAAPVCDGRLFLSQDSPTGLSLVSTNSNPMTYTPVGVVSGITYNALGYSPIDGKLYAMRTDSGNANHLLTLDQSTGVVTDLGAISGLPTNPAYNSGTVGSNGIYYVKPSGNTSVIYAINTGSQTFTTINLSQAFIASDIAWVGGASGRLYSVADNGQLFSVDTASGALTAHGAPDSTGGVLGAQFGGTNGLFGSANNGTGFYQINLSTGQKTKISDSPGSGTNDGGNCPDAPVKFPADLSITKTNGQSSYTAGSNVAYTITVTNKGPFTASGAKVTDALPGGITAATWSCTAAVGGSCTSSGSGGINDTITLPKDGTATYTLTMAVPADFSGNLVNTATVEADGSSANAINESPDPDPSNDSATDIDTPAVIPPAQADLSITKSNGATSVVPGGQVVYTIVASNAGPDAAVGATVADALPAALTGASWTCAAAAGGTCTASGSGSINDTVNLPAGASVIYTLTATVASTATGTLTNTATVTPPAGTVDPTPGNNMATDSDSVVASPRGVATPVPTLGEWALTLLVIALAGIASIRLRRARG